MSVSLDDITAEMRDILMQAGSADPRKAIAAQYEMTKALQTPLNQGVMHGDISAGIWEDIEFLPGTATEFPLDLLSPGTEGDFSAYTIPQQGHIPERNVNSNYVMVPTYSVGNSIDFLLKYARDARWDVKRRALQVYEGGFVRKNNGDSFHTILAAGVGRNLQVFDSEAAAGLFTKRLVALMKTVMRRNGGGNSTSQNQGKLTDLYVSPEGLADMFSWDLTQIDDATRRTIFTAQTEDGEPIIPVIGTVRLHDLDELGVGQEYNTYFDETLSGSFSGSKLEIVIGLDLSKSDSFVHPIRQRLETFVDETLHRQQRIGWYGWMEHGYSVLDSRRVLLGSF